jgi:hypothetical protein
MNTPTRKIAGTRYEIQGPFRNMSGRTHYRLLLDGVEVERGSKSDLTVLAGCSLQDQHERYDAIRETVLRVDVERG